MELYYLIWKILGVAFVLFLIYAFFVVRAQKKRRYQDGEQQTQEQQPTSVDA